MTAAKPVGAGERCEWIVSQLNKELKAAKENLTISGKVNKEYFVGYIAAIEGVKRILGGGLK
jgi:hypothetical protein